MRLSRAECGSIPLALLASIVTAGLISVLVATVIQNEQTVRFDRSFTGVVQTADAGIQDAYHRLNNQLVTADIGETVGPFTTELNGEVATWQVERLSSRHYEVTSRGVSSDGIARTVVAAVEEESLFFPGAFGDRLVAMNGTSTQIDSYESDTTQASCIGNTDPSKCWGTDVDFGTRKAALGTNNDFDFSGNVKVMRAILYDWEANPGQNTTAANPGGDRCKGNPCTAEILRFEDDKLDYGSDEQMRFIKEKLDACATGTGPDGLPRDRKNWVLGKKHDPPVILKPFSTADADNIGSPADPTWNNYYCADSLQILGDVKLQDATPERPVVIFVRESYSQAGQTDVNCRTSSATCPSKMNQVGNESDIDDPSGWRSIRPKAGTLQIYVQTEAASKGANVMIDQHSVFGGVIYAPRATCGSSGNAGVHVYGSLICRNIDNVGNWRFHYDDALSDFGRATYTVASWREEPDAEIAG
jgi:hypothetical protein